MYIGRKILGVGALLSMVSACSSFQEQSPATLFHNGTIYTSNAKQETVEAMVVRGNEIVFVGEYEEAKRVATGNTNTVNLEGQMILPGLHDTHLHPLLALEAETCALPEKNEYKLAQVISDIKSCLSNLGDNAPAAGEWITVTQFNGYGADKASYLGGFPDIATGLDSISNSHKLILIGADGHAYAVNHYALKNAAELDGVHYAVTEETLSSSLKDYANLIPLNEQGKPVGQLKSQAAWDLFAYETTTAAEFLQRQDEINNYFVANGITSGMEAWAHQRDVTVYSAMAQQNTLLPRISLSMVVQKGRHKGADGKVDLTKVMSDVADARAKAKGSSRLKVDSVKLMVDGVIEAPTQTAAVFKPYLNVDIAKNGDTHYYDAAHDKINRGLLEMEADEINRLVMEIDKAGYNAHFHAIGDRAVDIALTAVENARAANPTSTAPHNIAHLQLVRPEDVARFGQSGVFATPTPAWFAPWHSYDVSVIPYMDKIKNTYDLEDFYRQDSAFINKFYPVESIRKNGGIISIGSDAPIDFKGPRPFTNIMYGLLRGEWIPDPANVPEEMLGEDDYRWVVMNKEERMSIRDLIDAYTINGAKALQQDKLVGSLEIGKLADFIIINQDIIAMAESITLDEKGNEDTETAYLICDIAYDEEFCGTEVVATYIDGTMVYHKD